MAEWRNRVIERRVMKVNQVSINKRNPKRHPYQQTERLKALLDKFGMVSGGLLAFYDDENLNPTTGEPTLTLFDGHARQGLDPNQEWEICITDLNRAECDQLGQERIQSERWSGLALIVSKFDPHAYPVI